MAPPRGPHRFVVQRHRARRDHYDLRLEVDGTLVSWAVPKGPTLDPTVRRGAFRVGDHPLEYFDFEGVIPGGRYGAGDVTVWDWGTWEPHGTDDAAAALAAGELHAEMHGEKLRGRLVLVRRGAYESAEDAWLLVHKRDEHAVDGWDPDDHPRSVISGRTNEQVRADPDRIWRPDLPVSLASVRLRGPVAPGIGADESAALDDLPAEGGTWEVFGRGVRVRDLDADLFPAGTAAGPVSRRDLLRYAAQVAPASLPHLAGRALDLHRFPHGVGGPGSWQRRLPARAPGWVGRWEEGSGEQGTRLVVDEPAALVWAAASGALEWHAWTSRTDRPQRPTYAVVGIEPGTGSTWQDLLTLTRLHHTALDHLGLRSLPKLTGLGGVEVWVPVTEAVGFPEVRAWAETLAATVAAAVPDLVGAGSEPGAPARLDVTGNAAEHPPVAPYSPRAAAGGPVSTPLEWDELDDASPGGCTLRDLPGRLANRGDPFRVLLAVEQSLPPLR